jgi:hypothetical protein
MIKVKSHDIFDNLIARRCIEAKNIFSEVEKKSGIVDFAVNRALAEQHIYKTDYTIDDIYNELSKLLKVSDETINYLKILEINCEIENSIPITNNINKIEHGDILISDMYLPKNIINELLTRSKITKQAGFILTTHGKSSKKIWPILSNQLTITNHTGDNIYSDVESPASFGINTTLTVDHALNSHENFFRSNGLEHLARFSRELRLKKTDTSKGFMNVGMKNIQFQNNIPLLLMTAYEIYNTANKNFNDAIFFSSRDCFYLNKIYKSLFNDRRANYLYTSRISRTKCSENYAQYFSTNVNNKSLVVDLCGTGWSLGNLYSKLGIQPDTFLLHSLSNADLIKSDYEKIAKYTPPERLHHIINDNTLNNSVLEMCNYTTHGMVSDVIFFKEICQYQPVFEPPEYSKNVLETIEIIEECQNDAIELIDLYSNELINEFRNNSQKLPTMILELYKDMISKSVFLSDLSEYHFKQDISTMNNLKKV